MIKCENHSNKNKTLKRFFHGAAYGSIWGGISVAASDILKSKTFAPHKDVSSLAKDASIAVIASGIAGGVAQISIDVLDKYIFAQGDVIKSFD